MFKKNKQELEENIKVVTRVERHYIKETDACWKLIDEYCFKAKNLYNQANYIFRQCFIKGFMPVVNENNEIKFIKKFKCIGKLKLYNLIKKKNLKITYNTEKINYVRRKSIWLGHTKLDKLMQKQDTYRSLGSNCSQALLALLDQNWRSFFKSIADYRVRPDKYLGRPAMPKYLDKEGRYIFQLKNKEFRLKDNYIYFSFTPLKSLNNKFKTKVSTEYKIIQGRFIPRNNNYIFEIVYQYKIKNIERSTERIIGIDLGVENFLTICNNIGLNPFIVKGGILKSINRLYNKNIAKYKSELKLKNGLNWSKRLDKLQVKRACKIDSLFHLISKRIIEYCVSNNIDTIVVGNNKLWKQKSKFKVKNLKLRKLNVKISSIKLNKKRIKLNKKLNQKFMYIPYKKFIDILRYKAENVNINFFVKEESYTSQASFLDNDIIPVYNKKDKDNKVEYVFGGKRDKRGKYITKEGIVINADVNAAYNIIKKNFPSAFYNLKIIPLHVYVLDVFKSKCNQ